MDEKELISEIFDIDGTPLFVSKTHRFGTDAILLSKFLSPHRDDIVCDLCTGCGIIPVMLTKNINVPKKIYALDIDQEAHLLLKKTVEHSALENILPLHEDLKSITQIERESVDLVSANPPYFRKDSGSTRSDAQGIARHELMCDIDDVVKAAGRLLKYGGYLKMCNIPDRLSDVICTMRKYNIEPKELVFIQSQGGGNTLWLFLISGKKGGKSGLRVRIEE